MANMTLEFTIPKKRPFTNIYQFKIILLGTKPPVWRRIQVPQSYTFYDLHIAIQDAMGWFDSHLHCFEKREEKARWDYLVKIDCPYAVGEFEIEENPLYTTETSLTNFFKKKEDKMFYVYDFGDNWEHEVILEKILPKKAGVKYPICLDGKLACPLEDCGSIPGYYDCIKILKDGEEGIDDAEDLLKWIGDWNPNEFDPKKVIFTDPKKRFIKSWG